MSLWCMLGIAWHAFLHCGWRVLAGWRVEGEFGPAGKLLCIRVPALAWQKQSERRPELRIAAQSADSRLGTRAMLCTCTCAAHLSGGCGRLIVSRSPRPCRRRRTRTGRSPCTRRRGSRGPFFDDSLPISYRYYHGCYGLCEACLAACVRQRKHGAHVWRVNQQGGTAAFLTPGGERGGRARVQR